jgi:hypothetical protein
MEYNGASVLAHTHPKKKRKKKEIVEDSNPRTIGWILTWEKKICVNGIYGVYDTLEHRYAFECSNEKKKKLVDAFK